MVTPLQAVDMMAAKTNYHDENQTGMDQMVYESVRGDSRAQASPSSGRQMLVKGAKIVATIAAGMIPFSESIGMINGWRSTWCRTICRH